MAKVATLTTYYVDGKIQHNKFTSTIRDVERLFNNVVSDAEFFAKTRNGSISIERTDTTLYINYLDIPNTILVDVTRMVID